MCKNYEIINCLKAITKEKEQLKTLYYFALMYGFRPYYNKYNCGFIWVGGELRSEVFDSSYNLSTKFPDKKELDPMVFLHLNIIHKKIKANQFKYDMPMMVHFAYHYHHRTLFEDPTEDSDIDFLCSQIPKHKRTHIKNAYYMLKELKLTDKGKCEKFNPKQVDWIKIVKKEKV